MTKKLPRRYELETVIHEQRDEIDALRTELARVGEITDQATLGESKAKKLALQESELRFRAESENRSLREQLYRSATVCPKESCMLWKGHEMKHATVKQVTVALAGDDDNE